MLPMNIDPSSIGIQDLISRALVPVRFESDLEPRWERPTPQACRVKGHAAFDCDLNWKMDGKLERGELEVQHLADGASVLNSAMLDKVGGAGKFDASRDAPEYLPLGRKSVIHIYAWI